VGAAAEDWRTVWYHFNSQLATFAQGKGRRKAADFTKTNRRLWKLDINMRLGELEVAF
jgi:hypothetical protein